MQYICGIDYDSVVKKSEIRNCTGKRMEREEVIVNEATQIQKDNS